MVVIEWVLVVMMVITTIHASLLALRGGHRGINGLSGGDCQAKH